MHVAVNARRTSYQPVLSLMSPAALLPSLRAASISGRLLDFNMEVGVGWEWLLSNNANS